MEARERRGGHGPGVKADDEEGQLVVRLVDDDDPLVVGGEARFVHQYCKDQHLAAALAVAGSGRIGGEWTQSEMRRGMCAVSEESVRISA